MFVLRLFKMAANQSTPDLKRDKLSNFWKLKSANHVKFTEECVMCMKKQVLLKKKMFTYGLNKVL